MNVLSIETATPQKTSCHLDLYLYFANTVWYSQDKLKVKDQSDTQVATMISLLIGTRPQCSQDSRLKSSNPFLQT